MNPQPQGIAARIGSEDIEPPRIRIAQPRRRRTFGYFFADWSVPNLATWLWVGTILGAGDVITTIIALTAYPENLAEGNPIGAEWNIYGANLLAYGNTMFLTLIAAGVLGARSFPRMSRIVPILFLVGKTLVVANNIYQIGNQAGAWTSLG